MGGTVAATFYLVSFVRSNGKRDVGVIGISGDGDALSLEEFRVQALKAAKDKFGDDVAEIEYKENVPQDTSKAAE